jgi:hypothetical protein
MPNGPAPYQNCCSPIFTLLLRLLRGIGSFFCRPRASDDSRPSRPLRGRHVADGGRAGVAAHPPRMPYLSGLETVFRSRFSLARSFQVTIRLTKLVSFASPTLAIQGRWSQEAAAEVIFGASGLGTNQTQLCPYRRAGAGVGPVDIRWGPCSAWRPSDHPPPPGAKERPSVWKTCQLLPDHG